MFPLHWASAAWDLGSSVAEPVIWLCFALRRVVEFPEGGRHVTANAKSKGEHLVVVMIVVVVPWLLIAPATRCVYLRDESALAIECASILRQKLPIKLAIPQGYNRQTPDQPVLALTLWRHAPGGIASTSVQTVSHWYFSSSYSSSSS